MSELRELCAQLRDVLGSSDPALSAGHVCAHIAEDLAATEKASLPHASVSRCGQLSTVSIASEGARVLGWVSRSAGSSVDQARAGFANLQPLCSPHHREKTERDRVAGLLNGNGTRKRRRKERGPP